MPLRSLLARRALVLGALVAAIPAAAASPDFTDMRWRLIGPFRGGWATTAAGVPGDPATFYFGAADGGVWTTHDAGATWRPTFEGPTSASIGALAIAPGHPNVIWVGTGQVQQRWDTVDGDGVYRSTDAGATWAHLGLEDSKHIGAIWVDPRDPDVAVVAALGHLFGPNAERGLYRTTDGGRTFTRVLDRGPEVGAVDLASDPAVPDVLFASLWQVRRHPWLDYFQPTVGNGSGIVKSTDGGRTWAALAGNGLPPPPLGRIELAVAPGTGARRVWAAVQSGRDGGLFRSDDAGASWERVNADGSLGNPYACNLTADPKNPDGVWAVGRSLRVSTDGGRTFRYVKGAPGGDDFHAVWLDPSDPRRMIAAADQGATVTLNGGATWSSWYNQPTGQFYRLGLDDGFPYRVYSGQQDSGTVSIASRSDYGQITFRDWHPVGGDERNAVLPDPRNPAIVYTSGLGGRVSRWDARTGQVANVAPSPGGSYAARPRRGVHRYEWLTPFAIAPRPPHAMYLGAEVLFRSLDGGLTWDTVSPDLTGAGDDAAGCDGDVPVSRATACGFGSIFAIAPSPAANGTVWVGTSNGRVQLTRDDGKTWTEVTPRGLADWTRIDSIDPSPTDPTTAYVAADAHRLDDFRPMAFRTHDAGTHWTDIARGLPSGAWVGVVRQDPKRAGLLYAGTSRGVFVSFDDGDTWTSLRLNLPVTGINDLRVQGDDLVAATEGRAIWILDRLAPLRAGPPDGSRPVLVAPGLVYRLHGNQSKDTPLPPEEPCGANPPEGAVLDYILPAGITGPVTLEILDARGDIVRRFSSDGGPERPKADVYFTEAYLGTPARLSSAPGHHRFVWNLRYERPDALEFDYSIAAVTGREAVALPEGALVLPGTYRVRLRAGGATAEQPLEIAPDPRLETNPHDLADLLEFQRRVEAAIARSSALERERRRAEGALRAAAGLERCREALARLTPGPDDSPGRANQILASLAADLGGADALPTPAQRALFVSIAGRVDAFEMRWKTFLAGTCGERLRTGGRP